METVKLKQILTTIGFASVVVILAACGDSRPSVDETDPFIIGEAVDEREQVFSYSHIHGLSIHPEDRNKIFLASHDGLIEFDKQTKTAFYVGSKRMDLMGYSQVADSMSLMTSGHPEPNSSLSDPLGFLWSDDLGETWEVRSLYGMIDFHALTSTRDQERLLGYGSDGTNDVILESTDKGYSWQVVETEGLPLAPDEFFDLAIAPNNNDVVYAATSKGLFYSVNGGIDWTVKVDGFVTALYVIGDNEVIFYEASQNGLYRLLDNEFISYDLYLQTDAVNYIGIVDDQSHIVVATFQNNLLETVNHGDSWEVLVEEGNL